MLTDSHRRRIRGLWLPAAFAFLAAVSPAFGSAAPSHFESVRSFADLDGDLLPDSVHFTRGEADSQGYSYTVDFQMSAQRRSAPIAVHARDAWGLRIVARDVDGDHDLDLVVTSGRLGQAVDIWLNDGSGGFTSAGAATFPASIWAPERDITAAASAPTQDGLAIAGDGISALLPSLASHPIASSTLLGRALAQAAESSSCRHSTRPRAPPVL